MTTTGREIAGALARFWAGGDGPSHSAISTAFALAGYEDPTEGENKQSRVLRALREADAETTDRLVEELLVLLRSAGVFDAASSDPAVESLRRALERNACGLDSDGYLTESARPTSSAGTEPAPEIPQDEEEADVLEVAVPGVPLLVSALRRLAAALRPLVIRRHGRESFQVKDEYDLQDVVEAMLRSLYNDVRPEERTPSYGGISSTMDFLLREDALAIEVKVTRPGRGPRQIQTELLTDIHHYRTHPTVRTLIAVVYDISSNFQNPAGFEHDLSGRHNQLQVHVLVVGWPIPPPVPD